MKKLSLTLLSFFLITLQSIAGNIPASVQKAFIQKFPNAKNVSWDKENSHEYEVSFDWDGQKHSANFSDNGDWLETETTTKFNQLPEKVQTAFNSSHKGVSVKDAATIITSKGITKYEIEFKQGIKTVELFYSSEGICIK